MLVASSTLRTPISFMGEYIFFFLEIAPALLYRSLQHSANAASTAPPGAVSPGNARMLGCGASGLALLHRHRNRRLKQAEEFQGPVHIWKLCMRRSRARSCRVYR